MPGTHGLVTFGCTEERRLCRQLCLSIRISGMIDAFAELVSIGENGQAGKNSASYVFFGAWTAQIGVW